MQEFYLTRNLRIPKQAPENITNAMPVNVKGVVTGANKSMKKPIMKMAYNTVLRVNFMLICCFRGLRVASVKRAGGTENHL